jgi:hypothetical protein
VAQEADGRLVALLPEVLLGEVERIPESLKDEQRALSLRRGHSAEKNIIQLNHVVDVSPLGASALGPVRSADPWR